jgi:hypothetical protein
MKLVYGGVPYNTTKVRHYEVDTNSATCEPSAVQAGLTYFANGRKEVGTGKSFEFAYYGAVETNDMQIIPSANINVVQISSVSYPIKFSILLNDMKTLDFSVGQVIGSVIIDSIDYPITVTSSDNMLIIECDQTIFLEVFYGKDNYI